MIYCRACKRVSPRDSKYCQHCGGSFFVRYCGSGHASSPSAACCGTCGTGPLSDYVPAVRLGWIPTLLSLIIFVALWKLLLALFPTLLPGLLLVGKQVILHLMALLTNSSVPTVRGWFGNGVHAALALFCGFLVPLFGILVNCLLFGWLLELIPGPIGKLGTTLKQFPVSVALWIWRTPLHLMLRGAWRLLSALGRGVGRLLMAPLGIRPTKKEAQKETT